MQYLTFAKRIKMFNLNSNSTFNAPIKLLLILAFLFFGNEVFAQDYQTISSRIDSLANVGLPKSALVEVSKLDKLARKEKNAPMQIKAAIYRMTFQSYIEENSLVAIIDTLKSDIDRSGFPVRPILQSVLASMYYHYYQQNRWQFGQRTRLEKPGTDYTKWDLQTIIAETSRLYTISLHDENSLQNQSVAILDGILMGDKATRYLRPTLYDLLVQRALDFFLMDEPAIIKPKQPFVLNDPRLFGTSRTFAELPVKTSDTSSTFYSGIKYLQQAMLFHLQKEDEEAMADIDLKRLVFLHLHVTISAKDSLYLRSLERITVRYAAKPISADALVLLGRYYQEKDSLKTALSYFNSAADKYPQSLGGKNAASYINIIYQKQLSAVVEGVNAPNKPLLVSIGYHNVKTARMVIYKISATQYNQLAAIPSSSNRYNNGTIILPSDSVFGYLKKLKPVSDELLQLPDPHDYHNHNTEAKINPLQTGNYVLTIKDDASSDLFLTQLTAFKVSQLSFVARRDADDKLEVEVMDRETGAPMPGVNVNLGETEDKITDINGKCVSSFYIANPYSVKLTTATDTLYEGARTSPSVPNINSPTVSRTILFTDRQIYRPGQTIYFKGLYIQTQNRKNDLLPNKSLTVSVKDNNNKSIASIPVTTNEFGTFGGSFILPQNMLNGRVLITADHGSKNVSVEEYKRPAFQVEFLPVKNSYKPGDMVSLKGTVTAYSGYGISQAKVSYNITRRALLKDYRLFSKYNSLLSNNAEIVTDTIKTNDRGEFEIKFKATTDTGINEREVNYMFSVNADVTDGSGETRSANLALNVGLNNLQVLAVVPVKIFTRDSIRISAKINNLNGIMQSGSLQVNVYALKAPDQLFVRRFWAKPDQYLISPEQYKKDYPAYAYGNEDDERYWKVLDKVAELNRNTDGKQPAIFNLDQLKKQPTGTYKMVVSARNEQGDTTSATHYIYLVNELGKPNSMADWVIPIKTQVDAETPAEIMVGSGKPVHILMETYNNRQMLSSQWLNIPEGKQQLVKVPLAANQDNLAVQFFMVYQNRMYNSRQVITKKAEDNLDIRFLTFRNKLQPGEKEQWKLQISGKNKEAAEMVADLYDSSLDAIAPPDNWRNVLNGNNTYIPIYFNWGRDIATGSMTIPMAYNTNNRFNITTRQYEQLNMPGYNSGGEARLFSSIMNIRGGALDEIRIDEPIGNSDTKQVTPIDIRGYAGAQVTHVTLNGKEYTGGDGTTAMQNLPADILEKIQVIDDYGDQAGRNITTRKNFAETAFFYPQLHTDKNGEILIDFTIPESLTKWRFKGFAHTKDLKTGYIEQEIVTQKQLSINANMPRFLREGDTITVSARLANLTAAELKGKVNLQLFNALNMQPVSLLLNQADAQQSFTIAGATTKAVSFRMVIPAGLDALDYRLTADAGKFTDGEENTLPVLPNRTLVTESMPMMVRPGKEQLFTFNKLVNQTSTTLQNKSLTLEYTQNPVWYAVQALPYMMEFPYECSEQIFSRYYANSLASNLVNRMPVIKKVFDQWKSSNSTELLSNLEKNQELKSTLIEETPWLRDAENETEQKKRVALLFDLNKMSYELQQNLDKLQKKQLPNGGFPWFGGEYADRYITQHILAGMGQLYHSGIVDAKNVGLKNIADKAMSYLDNMLMDDAAREKKQKTYDERTLNPVEIHAYYAQSYFTSRIMSTAMQDLLADYMKLAAKQWIDKNVYEQAMIALTMQRNKKPEMARMIIRSLLETAQQSDDMGMYWAKNQLGYYWYQSPVETQSLMIELFTEAGNDKAVEEMKIWLLRNKQANNWKTTKATAAACYALLMKGNVWLEGNSTSTIKLNGKALPELIPDTKTDAGTGYIKTTWTDNQVKPELGKVDIKNDGATIGWGALYWQYLEKLDKITPSTTDIQLERKYFIQKQTDAGPLLTAVDATHQPKAGDLLKVVVYLKAGRDFEYIHLKDMRPAGTEPVDVLSVYKYQDGLYYYQVTKDVATNFFISTLNKGNYVFEYRLRVAQPGNFSTGISTIESMYAPEFNAHSEGSRLVFKPN